MEKHPERSWAKTNTQLWSLSMRDPISRYAGGGNNGANNNYNNNGNSGNFSLGKVNKPQGTEWRDITCWRFNKGKCNRKASECRFLHRCSHCGSASHTYFNCQRRKPKQSSTTTQEDKPPATPAQPTQTVTVNVPKKNSN